MSINKSIKKKNEFELENKEDYFNSNEDDDQLKKEEERLKNIEKEDKKGKNNIKSLSSNFTSTTNLVLSNNQMDIISIRYLNMYFLVLNSSIGFFFMGYNLGVYNTLSISMDIYFSWLIEYKQTLTSIVSTILIIGCLFGSIISGYMSSKFGRRKTILIFDIISIIGGGIAVIGNTETYIIGRFIIGLSVGSFSTIIPIYIQEYVPSDLVGKMGMFNFCFFSFGIVISFLIGFPIMIKGSSISSHDSWWRLMTLFPLIFIIINFIIYVLYFIEETPLYSIVHIKNKEKAKASIGYIYKDILEVQYIYNSIEETYKNSNSNSNQKSDSILNKTYLIRLIIGLVLHIGQQTSGINVFTFYSNNIFLSLEPDVNANLFSFYLSLSELIGNILCIFIIEYIGRRKVLLIGYSAVFICLSLMTLFFWIDILQWSHKYLSIIYYFFAGISTDPIVWIITADILPELGVSICTSSNWLSAIVVIISFPYIYPQQSIGLRGTFTIYSGLTLMYLIFNYLFLKETKNKNYNQIEKEYSKWR